VPGRARQHSELPRQPVNMLSGRADIAGLTPYELRNLAAHLEAAGQEDTLHRLLALETDAGTNFWFEAKDKGDVGGYVNDAQRALRLVRQAVDTHVLAGEPAREIALEIRYALLIASVRSAAGQVSTALLTAMVDKGVRSAEEVLAYLSQIHGGLPGFEVIASLAPHLPEPVRTKQLRDVLLAMASLPTDEALARRRPGDEVHDDFQRRDALSALTPYLPPDLMGEALRVARSIKIESLRAQRLAALGPRLPAQLHGDGVAAASEIQEPSLRIAALTALGIATSRKSLRAALAQNPETNKLDKVHAAILLAVTLPPELLSEVLAATSAFGPNRAETLTALAPRLPNDLLPEAVKIVQKMGDYDHPGEALAALAPRLSGAALRRACRSAARFHEPEDRIRALNELALRYSERDRDQILESSLQVAERANFWGRPDMKNAVVRLLQLLPQQLLPRALALARKVKPDDGGTAVLVAVGARLAGPDRETVLRTALRDTSRIDAFDPAWGMVSGEGSASVLGELAALLPGEVLPFVLEDVNPEYEVWDKWPSRLSAIAPHLQPHELREALRVARELGDGVDQCAAVAGLADYIQEQDRSHLLRVSLDACRRMRRYRDRTMALHALAAKLSDGLGEEALDIAMSIPGGEHGARARAEAARSVPPRLMSRVVAALTPGYERWKAVAFAALAMKAEEPTKTELFQKALAKVGTTDWDDTLTLDVDFIAQLAPDLPEQLLGEALDEVLDPRRSSNSRLRSSALAALAARFDGAERTAILEKALTITLDIHRESDRIQALVQIGAEVPGVAEAIRQVRDPKWRAVGLAELGERVPEEVMRTPIGSLSDLEYLEYLESVHATLCLLPFASPDRVLAVFSELRDSEEWPRLVEGEWFSNQLAARVPRLGAELLPALVELADSIPSSGRPSLLAALVETFRPLPQQRLHDCWVHARAALDDVSRSSVLKALATLAPLVDAVGGRTGARDSVASVHLVARWHP
jgi:hypothetical protein